ncbi:hypothetical protein FT641_19700 [Bacillus paranthracis]|uniref:hypothetical protein n=1 Tax=Bacillus paranthracis TaxID=2026186 RepID=UPI00187AC729|nr:hypothetical protein [Bacillus paranthracis]MBE7114714.1 hypothetical protein [Bacillus paranthracis]MBE7154919.1 hypothetical protein [Bacillus paranthracis]
MSEYFIDDCRDDIYLLVNTGVGEAVITDNPSGVIHGWITSDYDNSVKNLDEFKVYCYRKNKGDIKSPEFKESCIPGFIRAERRVKAKVEVTVTVE